MAQADIKTTTVAGEIREGQHERSSKSANGPEQNVLWKRQAIWTKPLPSYAVKKQILPKIRQKRLFVKNLQINICQLHTKNQQKPYMQYSYQQPQPQYAIAVEVAGVPNGFVFTALRGFLPLSLLIAYSYCGNLVSAKNSSAIFSFYMWAVNLSQTYSFSLSSKSARDSNTTRSSWFFPASRFCVVFEMNLYRSKAIFFCDDKVILQDSHDFFCSCQGNVEAWSFLLQLSLSHCS